MKSRFLAGFMALMLAFSIGGCATKTTPTFDAKYYPECYDPIDKLCKDQSNKEEVKGAVAGGLIGALGGAIVGGLATGKVEGALIGAGVGAAAGALSGFFAARLNKIQDQNQRLAEYQNVLGEQSKGWDLERASVEKAYKCYGEQIDVLTRAMKAKKITREEFRARMDEIFNGIKYINTYWADSQTRMDEKLADGDAWLKNEDEVAAKAKQRALQRKVQNQKNETNKLRAANSKANDATNKLKADTQSKYEMACKEYLDEVRSFAGIELLLAMN